MCRNARISRLALTQKQALGFSMRATSCARECGATVRGVAVAVGESSKLVSARCANSVDEN